MSVVHEALSRRHSTRGSSPHSSANDHGAIERRAPSVPSVTSTMARARPWRISVSAPDPSSTSRGAALRSTNEVSSSGSSVTRAIVGAIVSSSAIPARSGL